MANRYNKPAQSTLRRAVSALFIVALASSSVACNQLQSDPVTLIKEFRIVAIRAEPPYIAGPGVPGTSFGTPTEFTPLVVDHGDTGKLCYAWRLCPFAWTKDGNYRCIDPSLEVDLGTGPTAKATALDVFSALENVEKVAEKIGLNIGPSKDAEGKDRNSGLGDQVESALGLQVSVLFMIGKPSLWGGTCPKTSAEMLNDVCPKRAGCIAGYTKVALATSPKHLNESPTFDGLKLDGVAWPAHVTPTIRHVDDAPQVGGGPNPDAAELGVEIEPLYDAKKSMEVIRPAQNGQPAVTETLTMSWYSDNGVFRYSKTSDRVWKNRFLPARPGENFDEDASKDEVPASVWIVIRDNRNGLDWASRNVKVSINAPKNVHPLCAIDDKLKGCADIDPATGKPKAKN